MILALSGKKKSGKDTIADFLVKDQNFVKISLATPLKNLIIDVFKIESKYLNDDSLKDKELPEFITIDYEHIDKIRQIVSENWGFPIDYEAREKLESFYGTEIKTPRKLMQTIGTDMLRNHIRDDIFIVLLAQALKEACQPVVIPDARLQNEREFLKKIGAVMAIVKRHNPQEKADDHISENDLGKEDDYDLVIENNIELGQLRSEINLWYTITHKK
jgi:hypothetical protein